MHAGKRHVSCRKELGKSVFKKSLQVTSAARCVMLGLVMRGKSHVKYETNQQEALLAQEVMQKQFPITYEAVGTACRSHLNI